MAQVAPRNNVIVETYDSKGNKVTTTKATDGSIVTQKEILMGPAINRPFNPDTIDKNNIVIQVYKAYGRMYVYHKDKFLTSYRCVFGKVEQGSKQYEGDKRTPEGWFTITKIRPHGEWTLFMDIDYPNFEAYRQFEANKKAKKIPANARIGGLIGIHGVWKGGDDAVKNKFNWTDGCISVNNSDIVELSKIVQPGTRIFIGWDK